MIQILQTLLIIYVGTLIGSFIGILITEFLPAKGLWRLVPLRVTGWKSPITGKIYKRKWSFSRNYD